MNIEPAHTFTPEDFGLTEADVAAYKARQAWRRSVLDTTRQRPLSPDLIRRLNALPQLERLFPQRAAAEREELLHELKTAMLDNLRALLPISE